MRPIPSTAGSQHGVFTTPQALEAGWTSHALRHAVAVGSLERLGVGVYAAPVADGRSRHDSNRTRLRRAAVALALTHCDATVSHRAAAVLHDLPTLGRPTTPCVTHPRGRRGTVRGAHLHRAALPASHVVAQGAVHVTSPARTVVDMARERGRDDGIAAADAALRLRRCSREDLQNVLVDCTGWPLLARAKQVVELADPRAESVLESISRLRIVDAGLPRPELQTTILSEAGFCGRSDFYWDEFGVIGEADGMAKYDGRRSSLRDEKARQDLFEKTGLIVVRWMWDDLFAFGAVVERLLFAFARGLPRGDPGRRWRVRYTPLGR